MYYNSTAWHALEVRIRVSPTTEPTPLQLVGYLRVSTEEQAAKGLSLAAQRARLRSYCRALGANLVAVEADEGVSGKVPPSRRPGLARALGRIDDSEVNGIVFVKLDRLSRSVRDVLDLAERARAQRWHLVSVQEQLDTSSALGKFVLTMFAALAEMERRQTAERTIEGMQQVACEGRGYSRFLPFGFRVAGRPTATTLRAGDRRPLVEHPEEMRILKRMQRLRSKGMGARRIAKALNARSTNPRTGRPWTPSNIAAILRTAEKRRRLEQSARWD